MTSFIALLRGVNVGGNKKIAMADLRACAEKLGFEQPQTLLQSGNLVFRSAKRSAADVEKQLQRALNAQLGFDCEVIVRTAEEWKAVVAKNPFADAAKNDPGHVLLMCLRDAPPEEAVAALRSAIVGREVVEVRGRDAYFVYPDGVGTSRLTNTVIEKRLGTRGTARNWNTVLKLRELLASYTAATTR